VGNLATQLLTSWQSFYVLVGSSGGALIGIQFVVIALVADMRKVSASGDSIGAFATPTVVHLGGALTISAIMSAPWPSLWGPAIAIGVCGLAGLAYSAVVLYRARRQKEYKPVWEDWIWYTVMPSGAYAALTIAGLMIPTFSRSALFTSAASALCLLFIGIHNAWDTVTYMVVSGSRSAHGDPDGKGGPQNDGPDDSGGSLRG
jgi:hypothetical protein